MAHLPPSPFLADADARFVLDVERFLTDIEPEPSFLRAPRPEYLRAVELMPIVEIIRGHAR